MDERHWFIAQRIGLAFNIDTSLPADNNFLESFICSTEVLDKINSFLCMNGSNKLFFCCPKHEISSRKITVTDSILKLPKTLSFDECTILYFIRHETSHEVSPTQIQKEVFCGEIKSASQILFNVFNDFFMPLVKTNQNWQNCSDEFKSNFIHNMDKYVGSIGNIINENQTLKNLVLKRVDSDLLVELKQPRLSPDSQVIKALEELALDWISTIENVLSDIGDEKFIHPSIGPNSELDRWQRKQRLLLSVTEQLKTKECKSVMSALISVKSRVLKKWKVIDIGITDAQNECRDKVKFLESLRRPIDQFYQDASPHTLITSALPSLCTSMRTIESVSRYYARQGYLGILFAKVTNQIVTICKQYLSELSLPIDNVQQLWPSILKEIEENSHLLGKEISKPIQISNEDKRNSNMQSRVSNKPYMKETKEPEITLQTTEGLFSRLKTCLLVQSKYKEYFKNLRDGLGGNQALSSFPSASSVYNSEQSSLREKKSTILPVRRSNNAGILMSEEDTIFNHLDTFCSRIKAIMDEIVTLAQFRQLQKASTGLARPKREDFGQTLDEDAEDYDSKSENGDSSDDEVEDISFDDMGKISKKNSTNQDDDDNDQMDPLYEESEKDIDTKPLVEDVFEKSISHKTDSNPIDEVENKIKIGETAQKLFATEKNVDTDIKKIMKKAQTLSKEDVKIMRKYYTNNQDGPNVSIVIDEYVEKIVNNIKKVTSSQILDVETKESSIFNEIHRSFAKTIIKLDKFISAYLNVMFLKERKTSDGLNILMKFDSVSQRSILRPIINDKYVEMFANYDNDLNTAQSNFERFKNNPPLLRNAPPVAGAISWVRQLVKNIQEPMKLFESNKYVSSLEDFSRITKKYNQLNALFSLYESTFLNQWKSSIDSAKQGMNQHLLIQDPETKQLIINADDRLAQLFHEAKWLKRMGIDIPQVAHELIGKEKKFKQYRSHLEMLFTEYDKVYKSIPDNLLALFEPHVKLTLDVCNPGCFILTWNSLNIDAFLKSFEIAIGKLNNLVHHVSNIKQYEIYKIIQDISAMLLFNFDLAFSQRWSPDDFINIVAKTTSDASEKIIQKIERIELIIEEIGNLLVILPREQSNLSKKKSRLSLRDLKEIDPMFRFVQDFYSVKLYDALYTCITRSLKILAEGSGYQFEYEEIELEELNEDIITSKSVVSEYELLEDDNDDNRKNYFSDRRLKSSVTHTSGLSSKSERPFSTVSVLSKATWTNERKFENSFLNLELVLKYVIPNVMIDPNLDETQKAVKTIAFNCVELAKRIKWKNPRTKMHYYDSLCKSREIIGLLDVFGSITEDIRPTVKTHLSHFKLFEFLWKEDLNKLFDEFIKYTPEESAIKREVERLVRIEKKVLEIPEYLNVGPVCLKTEAVKTSLKCFAFSWKSKYASLLHEMAREKLHAAIVYRENVQTRLSVNVQTLEQLNDSLQLLEELNDMENKIDAIYLPIELIYDDLRRYELLLNREEIEQVTTLRDKWEDLMRTAESVRVLLLQEKRSALEQELDKQVKTFVVEVIRFRNSFDAQGPAVAHIDPLEAVKRLGDFQKQYDTYDARRKTLDSISILFGIACKPFPELDKTGEELELLTHLYNVYQVFLNFEKVFKSTLWSEVDLFKATSEITTYWQDFLNLPEKLQENWDAYYDLKNALQKYKNVLPILCLLNAKEIRNRHWLQVMQVTKSSFQLESTVFKLSDIVDIGLEIHKATIEEICYSAKKEQELEIKMRTIEEDWNEQVLSFIHYKDLGEICLDKNYTDRLLEQLDDAQECLANMLTSKYVVPLRNEVSGWWEKLKIIGDVLELWIEVQEMWINCESVFSNAIIAKEMPAEAKRFNRVDKSWIRSQKQSFEIKSVIQCCLGSSVQENVKRVLLKDLQKELEICFKSLNNYLEKKRKLFPRFYFLSNLSLLTLLSRPNDIQSVKPQINSLFTSVSDLRLEEIQNFDDDKATVLSSASVDKNLHRKSGIHTSAEAASNLLSINYEISELISNDGDVLKLYKRVAIEKSVETWIARLKDSISETLKRMLNNSLVEFKENRIQLEEFAYKYPIQICLIGLMYFWTREVEISIQDVKNDRKAIASAAKKFAQIFIKLVIFITKSKWPNQDEQITAMHKLRLEGMITFASYLKDAFESLANRKIPIKELNDFEWQRCFRVYLSEDSGSHVHPKFSVLDENYHYGYEFYGVEDACVITPLTERCFLSMWQATRLLKGSLVYGKANSGKTQTIRGFAQFMGRYLGYLFCTNNMDHQSIGNILIGLSQEGAWGFFDGIQNLSGTSLSWFTEYLSSILNALRKRTHLAILSDGKEISLNQNFSLFVSMNSVRNEADEVPLQIRSLFRVICLMEPNMEVIINAKCIQYGIKCGNILASRLKILHEICQGTFSSFETKNQLTLSCFIDILKAVYDKQKKQNYTTESRPNTSYSTSNLVVNKYSSIKSDMIALQIAPFKELTKKSKSSLVNYCKNEHLMIAQAIIEFISPRLNSTDAKAFKKIVLDVFNGGKDDSKAQNTQQSPHYQQMKTLEKIIEDKAASEFNIFPNRQWIDKCLQIYSLSNIFRGIILCGQPCTGKSSTLTVLVESLSELSRVGNVTRKNSIMKQQSEISSAHKLKKINPLGIDEESLLYGSITHNNEWKDGLLTYTLKKANRNQSTTWLCLDAPILPNWSDNFNTILDNDGFIQLKNGDRLSNSCKLVFETGSLIQATPSVVSKAGIIFYGNELIGWRSLARSWLENRSPLESQCLQKCFNKTMDEINNYVLKECKPMLPVREEGLFISLLNLLHAMLSENPNISSEVHIERLYLYCLIWTFGGVLHVTDQKGFNDLLNNLTSALPDDDLKSSIFAYYVDESGEWDLWSARVQDIVYLDTVDLLGNVFVDTIDTIRCRIFMEFAYTAGNNCLIYGETGCGKTRSVEDFMQDFDANVTITKRLNFSAATSVSQIQKFIESNIVHRQGFSYGADEKKHLAVFIDDINIPEADSNGVQRCNEFLRMMVDSKIIHNYSKPFELKKLEDIVFYATMTPGPRSIDPRLLRHFTIIHLPTPKGNILKSIFNGTLEATMLFNEKMTLESDLHTALVEASSKLLDQIVEVFKKSPMPGRQHYLFNMKHIITILQNLRKLNETQRTDSKTVVSLWRHEVYATIGDQLSRFSDQSWLENTVNEIIKEKLANYCPPNKIIQNFMTFSLEAKSYDRPLSTFQNRSVKVNLLPVESIENVRLYVETQFNRYKEEFGHNQMNLSVSENVAEHIIRIHRVLSFSHCGNLLLFGNSGNHLSYLIKLAVYLAEIQPMPVDSSKTSSFFDSLRSAVRSAGAEGKCVSLIFTSKDLIDPEYLDTINSLINNGECVHLFSNDEMDGLYQALGPSIKREYPNFVVDPKKFFNIRVKKNLHICIALTPHSRIFQNIVKNYPGILSNCQIYWIRDWLQNVLLTEAKFFMRNRLESNELRDRIAKSMCDIHLYMLNETKQIPWAGNMDKELKIKHTKIVEKKKEQVSKTFTQNIPNWPYSKNILQEQIKLQHISSKEKSKLHFFIGPSNYLKFMNSFWYFFTSKAKKCEEDIIRLRRVLDTLNKTRANTDQMRSYIKDLRVRCKKAELETEKLLQKVIEKTTAVEKLKAKIGRGGSLATLMQMQDNIVASNFDIEKERSLLLEEETDEYDVEFARMKEESLKSKQLKLQNELDSARNSVEDCKRLLADKRRQAEHWKNKVDKACIERIRAFQNPPALIGQIMEMTMIMIGKKNGKSGFNDSHTPSGFRENEAGNVIKQNATQAESKSKKPFNKMDRLDRSVWKTYQLAMQDSQKFVDLLHSVDLEEGLPVEIYQAVESYLAIGRDGQLGVTGEGLLLENAKDVNVPVARPVDDTFRGITISSSRYASEDAATLVHYAIAVVEYTRQCGPLRQAREKVEHIKNEIVEYERKKQERDDEIQRLKELEATLVATLTASESDKEVNSANENSKEEYNESNLPRLQNELQELQAKFDEAAVKKHKLNIELSGCLQRLEAATTIIQSPSQDALVLNPDMVSLTNLEEQWKKWIEEHLSHEQTLTNCLITAAYISYLGAFDKDLRTKLCSFFFSTCSKYDIPFEPQYVFKDMTLAEFLYTPIQLKEIKLLRLPDTENILENGCYIIEDKSYDSWPLICDPSRRSIDWIKTYYKDKQIVAARFSEMKSSLETCLSEGQYLLLTDCNVVTLMNIHKLEVVLRNKHRFINSQKPFKLNLGNQEVECRPSFRLFLHTIHHAIDIPSELAAYSTVLTYNLTREDIEEEMLDRFMQLAKPRVDSEKHALLQEKVDTLKIIDPLEQDITDFLASDVDLLHSVEPTKKLSDLKKLYDEAVDSNLRIETAEEQLIKNRESFRDIAIRASVCYDVISTLQEINPNYVLSFAKFVELFNESLYQFERSSVPQVITKFTTSIFNAVARLMNENDKKVFGMLLALEIETSYKRVNPGEKDFIISPSYGAAVMQSITGKQATEHKYWQVKKPFDWMQDEQFLNLQYLAIYFNWFADPFDRMSKDGREMQWRSLCETDAPETLPLPDKLDDVLTQTQRLCVIRAVRGDRILHASISFINNVLGKNFVSSASIDLESVYLESSANRPIVLMYSEEPECVKRAFTNYAKTKDKLVFNIIEINGLGMTDEKQIKRMLGKPMEEGSWVLLHNCHNTPQILNLIEGILIEAHSNKTLNATFRCWLSILQNNSQPPSSIILNSPRIFINTPMTMKENIVRSFSWIDLDILKSSSKPEWPALLHNLCYLHSCLKLRSRYMRCGWNLPYSLQFTTEEFIESCRAAAKEFSFGDGPSRIESAKSQSDLGRYTSWNAIRYILADLIYGCLAVNSYDLEAIETISEFWISSKSASKELELTKLKYKIPTQFFSLQPKMPVLLQALENIPHLQLELPEACHLLQSSETILGDDLYVISRLSKVLDALPSSKTNPKLYNRPLTPFESPNMANINTNSISPLVHETNVFSSVNYNAIQNKKFGELSDYCNTILNSKLPKPYTKDQIVEKVKKHGSSVYMDWIANEMTLLSNLINTIKNQVTIIKNATDVKSLGCNWDEDLVRIADCIYYQIIPDQWCILFGVNQPFTYYGLGSYFNDLQTRYLHIEKCLTLGRERNPAFNLSAFYNPQVLLSLFKLETIRTKNQVDDTCCIESLVFQTEMTARDKEHLRDPPKEGMFIYGLYLWGCHWEKGSSELVDVPTKSKEAHTNLPVIHLTCWSESDKPLLNDPNKAPYLFKCPVYISRSQRNQSILDIDLINSNNQPSKWSMRGVCCTLKPF